METLKIQIPEGYKVDSFDTENGVVKFAPLPKDIKERIKSIDDACKELGENDEEVMELFKLQEAGITSHILYTQMLVVIAKALNEGWKPDWTNGEWDKYFPWFTMGSPSGVGFSYDDCVLWCSLSDVGSRLCFKSSELAKYAGKQFLDIYKKSFTI